MLITVMSERELHVPRLGRVVAEPGFRLVAAMNPFDAIGTARISSAVYDRVCRLSVDYQIGGRGGGDRRHVLVRRRRSDVARARWSRSCGSRASHPDVRIGSSVRGAHRHRRGGAVAGRRCAAAVGHAFDVGLDAVRSSPCRGGCDCARAACARPSRSSPSCGARCSAGARRRRCGGKSWQPRRGQLPLNAADEGRRRRRTRPIERVAQARPRRGASSPRNPRFEQVSPEVGELDEAAVDEGLVDDPDDTLAMLADITGRPTPGCASWPDDSPGGCSSTSPVAARRGHGARVGSPSSRTDPTGRPRPRRQPRGDRRGAVRPARPSTRSGCGSGRG